MRSRLSRIGNSRGVRIPKPLLGAGRLQDTVQIRAEKGRVVIQPVRAPRYGWAEAFAAMAARGDEKPLLERPQTRLTGTNGLGETRTPRPSPRGTLAHSARSHNGRRSARLGLVS